MKLRLFISIILLNFSCLGALGRIADSVYVKQVLQPTLDILEVQQKSILILRLFYNGKIYLHNKFVINRTQHQVYTCI